VRGALPEQEQERRLGEALDARVDLPVPVVVATCPGAVPHRLLLTYVKHICDSH
jgi:hypothetical protein